MWFRSHKEKMRTKKAARVAAREKGNITVMNPMKAKSEATSMKKLQAMQHEHGAGKKPAKKKQREKWVKPRGQGEDCVFVFHVGGFYLESNCLLRRSLAAAFAARRK